MNWEGDALRWEAVLKAVRTFGAQLWENKPCSRAISILGGGAYAVAMICRNMLNLLLGQESQVGVQVLSSDSTMTSSVCTQVFTCVQCIYCTQVGTALHHSF